MTHRQQLEQAGIIDVSTIIDDVVDDGLCDVCNEHITKNLSPSDPACEGRWCDEAWNIWLDEEEL